MKKGLILLSILLLSVSLMAQVRTGTIWGHVTDTQGAPLPGVSVTLKSTYSAVITQVTDAEGIYRFVSLEPSRNYTVTAELQGFKKQEKTGIIVVIGQQSKIDIQMEQGKLEEEVTVMAVTPTVDAKKTSVGKNVTQDIMQALPTSRDPWSVMLMTPGIQEDRENVGGSESGQQAGYYVKGDSSSGGNNIWAVDGVVVTDPAAIGASPIYWDFDAFEEMNVVTGGADVTIQTGGVALNMVTRRGGNKVSFGGRFYLTDNYFQAVPSASKLASYGLSPTSYNKINQIKDYGFNLGGPVWKDHIWLWGSYGVQDINAVNIVGGPLKPVLYDYDFKINIQPIPSNRFEAMYIAGNKTYLGRSSSQSFPEGVNQSSPYHWGNPIIKLQDEQTVANDLLLSAKFAYNAAGFQLPPVSDPSGQHLVHYDVATGVQFDSNQYITMRPMHDYDFHVQYYNDKLFGVSHEFKLGVEYNTREVTTQSYYPGNIWESYDLNYPDFYNSVFTPGMTLDTVYANNHIDIKVKQLTGFVQDTISTGRFNFLLGLRYDRQTPSIVSTHFDTVNSNPVWSTYFTPDVRQALYNFCPGITVPNISPDYHWNLFAPRLGITYDLFGTGKTILKLSGSLYGDFMGSGSAAYLFYPRGASSPWFQFWALPSSQSGGIPSQMGAGNLYFTDPVYDYAPFPLIVNGVINPQYVADAQYAWWGGFSPGQTQPGPSNYFVNSNATTTHTWELLFSIDHELMPNFSVGLNASYRKYNHFAWDDAYYANGVYGDYSIGGVNTPLGPSAYAIAGYLPSSFTYNGVTYNMGAAAGKPYYLLTSPYTGTPYSIHELNTNYETYWGIDLVVNKRLSNKWMLDGSLTYQDQWYHYGNGLNDPSNLWALQNELYAPYLGGGSGKISNYIFSHWFLKLEGLYQLPYDFNISFTFNARAGHPIPQYLYITDVSWSEAEGVNSNPIYFATNPTYLSSIGSLKLPTFYQLNLRLEKMIKMFDTGRIYLMADAFNVTNAAIVNRRYDQRLGRLYIYSKNADGTPNSFTFSPYALNDKVNEILNPFIARFGVRFQF